MSTPLSEEKYILKYRVQFWFFWVGNSPIQTNEWSTVKPACGGGPQAQWCFVLNANAHSDNANVVMFRKCSSWLQS